MTGGMQRIRQKRMSKQDSGMKGKKSDVETRKQGMYEQGTRRCRQRMLGCSRDIRVLLETQRCTHGYRVEESELRIWQRKRDVEKDAVMKRVRWDSGRRTGYRDVEVTQGG